MNLACFFQMIRDWPIYVIFVLNFCSHLTTIQEAAAICCSRRRCRRVTRRSALVDLRNGPNSNIKKDPKLVGESIGEQPAILRRA
jgi:hypothetical protein